MTETLIDRLNKNGDRVYLLTGQRENTPLRQKVFEKYNYAYDDESVKDVFESVKGVRGRKGKDTVKNRGSCKNQRKRDYI